MMGPREQLWQRVRGTAADVYSEIPEYDDFDARLTADAAAAGWYANDGFGRPYRKRRYAGLARMPKPGDLLNLGEFLELEWVTSDGTFRAIKYLVSDNVRLWWSHDKQAIFILPYTPIPACTLPPRPREDKLARMWAKGRPAVCASRFDPVRPRMPVAYPSLQVSYRSGKFTPEPINYIHHFGPEVIAYFSSEPFQASRAPEAIMIRGGRLSLTSHGIDG